jgi:N-acetylmuramoyl-L-alanine amidase
MNDAQQTELFLLALAIYREARGTSQVAKIAVGCVIRNRVQNPAWYGKDWFTVITKKFQFSSFNNGDPNSTVFGAPGDPIWQQCLDVAKAVYSGTAVDNTCGALYYYNDPAKPDWAFGPNAYKHVADVGPFHFYKP